MNHEPDVYKMLFEQTPIVVRFMLGVLSVGLFTIASYVYRRNQTRVEKIEIHMDAQMARVYQHVSEIEERSRDRDEHILRRLETIDNRLSSFMQHLSRH